jgi:plasmid maintenance system antidote protein VapI
LNTIATSIKMSTAPNVRAANQHYREGTALGISLLETLDELIKESRITPELAFKILSNFDATINQVLSNNVQTTFKAKAHLDRYNHVDDVLNLTVTGKLTLYDAPKLQYKELELNKMRIVAMRAHDASQPSQRPG